ncbi:MAG: hypothetical protein HZA31_08875 [Opitutae bacterium]|nr:hypothetical protein [Opitutae bacterium]
MLILLFAGLLGLDFSLRAPRPLPDMLTLVFTPSTHPDARSEPLIVTGAAGSADFLYVRYVDANTLVFGFDCWGFGGPLSPEVKVNPGQPIVLKIAMPALVNLAGARKTQMLSIHVEGGMSWQAKVSTHECSRRSVQWGCNRIGGTSCSDSLTGMLRKPDGAVLQGAGADRYYTWGERCSHWRQQAGWMPAAYLVVAICGAWLGVYVGALGAGANRLRRRVGGVFWSSEAQPGAAAVAEK